MSDTNGHVPAGAVVLTRDTLRAKARKRVSCPRLSERTGEPCEVVIRPIRLIDYLAMVPPDPPDYDTWPKDDAAQEKLWRQFFESMSPEERIDRTRRLTSLTWAVLQLGVAEPRLLTQDDAKDLAEDAEEIAIEILYHSGIKRRPEAVAVAVAAAAPEVVDTEPEEVVSSTT